MNNELKVDLSPEEIAALSSVYIDKGLKQEAWRIQQVKVEGSVLSATVNMTSTFVSPTDPGGFHLTIFCTQEILAQLANIHLHVNAGLKVKSRESWMRDCHYTYRSVIRQTENIQVEMDMFMQKWVGETLVGWSDCRMFDDNGGLFKARLKGLLR